ncbi:hypothetical protein FACS1894170_11400 [Planctomycetales bacterium]|nr:hypothetical protein FACS1894170_11400 [Planctomycetales bacterium]
MYKSNSIDNLRVDRQNDTEQYAFKVILNAKRYAGGTRDNDKNSWYVEEHSTNREQGTSLITIKRFPCAAFAFWVMPLQSQCFEIHDPTSRTEWEITSITKEKQEGMNVIVWKVTDKQQLTGQIVFLEDKQYAIRSYQVIAKTPSGQKTDFTCEYEGEEIFRGEKIPLVKRCTYHHIIGPGSSHERVAEHREWTITSIVPGEVALDEFDPEKVLGVKIVEPTESKGHFIFRIIMVSVGLFLILIWLYLYLRDKSKRRS